MAERASSLKPYVPPVTYAAQRALRAVELLVFAPAGTSAIAEALGVEDRTARRLMRTLVGEGYVERVEEGRRATWLPTVRLMALAAQLATRLPLVERGRAVIENLHESTGLGAALLVPSYTEVLVIAAAGEGAPPSWTLLPAADTAAGLALLVQRPAWRAAQFAEDRDAARRLEAAAAEASECGTVISGALRGAASLATHVPSASPPLAALAVFGAPHRLAGERAPLSAALAAAATRMVGHLADEGGGSCASIRSHSIRMDMRPARPDPETRGNLERSQPRLRGAISTLVE